MVKRFLFFINFFATVVILSSLIGCGAYFNTYYNAKKQFKIAEKKRMDQEKKNKKAGLNSNTRKVVKFSEYSKAIEKGSKVLELYPNSRYVDDALMLIGKSFYYTGDYIKAQRKFEELITLLPNSKFVPQAKLWSGNTFIAQNDFSQAKLILNELVSQNVNRSLSGEAQMMLGELYFNQKDFASAIKEYENFIGNAQQNEDKVQAQLRIGQCYIELDDYPNAAQMFKKGLDFGPNLEQKYILELIYGQTLREIQDYNTAINEFVKMTKDALTRDELASVRLEIAETLIRSGDNEKAIIALEDIIRNFTKTDPAGQAYFKLGLLYMVKEGDFNKALEQFDLSKKEFPRSAVQDSVTFWLKYLNEWDNLNFEVAVYNKAFENLDPTSADTIGNYVIEENDESDVDFVFPDLFVDQDSLAKAADSLRIAAVKDSVRADSLKNLTGENPEYLKSEEQTNSRNRKLTLNQNSNTASRNRNNAQAKKKILKKVTVPRNPKKLESKLIAANNKIAELYFFQFNIPDSAHFYYDYLIKSYPENELYLHWLFSNAYILRKLGFSEQADSISNQIVENYPESEYTFQILNKTNNDQEKLDNDPANQLFKQAEIFLFDKEMMDSSLYVYQKIVENYPESEFAPKSLFSMAYIYDWFKNDSSNALQNYRQLISQYPETDYAIQGKKKIAAMNKFIKDAELEAIKKAKADSVQAAMPDSVQAVILDSLNTTVPDSSENIKTNKNKLPLGFSKDPRERERGEKVYREEDDYIPRATLQKKAAAIPDSVKTKEKTAIPDSVKTKEKTAIPDSVKTKKKISPSRKNR